MSNNIEIIYQDEHVILVNKPVNLPVHKNDFMPKDAEYLLKSLGQITGKGVFNVHRLDSKTSGIILLCFDSHDASILTKQFEQKTVDKKYHAITRLIPPDKGTWDDKVLIKKRGRKAKGVTHFKTLRSIQTSISYQEYEDIHLSLVEIYPETGKWHQIRQHFAKNRFDIVGDTHHGDWTLNKIITAQTEIKRLFLHASELSFNHPATNERMTFKAELPEKFQLLFDLLAKKN